MFLRVSLLLLKFRSTLSKGSDRATSPSCCSESGCRDNSIRSCTSYSRRPLPSFPVAPALGRMRWRWRLRRQPQSSRPSPIPKAASVQRVVSGRGRAATLRGREGRAGKRIATSRQSTVCPPPNRGPTVSADPLCRSWAVRFSLLLIPTCVSESSLYEACPI